MAVADPPGASAKAAGGLASPELTGRFVERARELQQHPLSARNFRPPPLRVEGARRAVERPSSSPGVSELAAVAPAISQLGGRSSPPIVGSFFGPHGVLEESAPPHWVLEACQRHPLCWSQECAPPDPKAVVTMAKSKRPLSKRAMQINADRALTKNKAWVKGRVGYVLAEFESRAKEDAGTF